MPRRAAHVVTLVCLVAALASGCRREEKAAAPAPSAPPVAAPTPAPFRVTGIELGNAVDPGERVTVPVTTFTPTDTIYVSILSDGSAAAVTLAARWTYEGGTPVAESSETIAPTGPAATEFHIAKPSGWPAGKYTVEISANGAPAGAREFEVR